MPAEVMPTAPALPLLYQDAEMIAVDKPSGLAVIPGRGDDDCLLDRLRKQLNQHLLVVHRLDKGTSGVTLLARSTEAQRFLTRQFLQRSVEKEYLAIVAGRPVSDEGEIEAPIGTHPTDKKRMAVIKHGGRPALTRWRVEQRYRNFALLRVFPKTGKTHQIRVHLAHIGLPLAIDPLYNFGTSALLLSQFKRGYRAKPGEEERPLIERLTLHAERLRFVSPLNQSMETVSPLPRDFRAACAQLSRHG